MGEVDSNRLVYLDDYILSDKYTLVDSGVNSFIIPHQGEEENIYKNLSQAPHLTVFHKKDIPVYWHYANNRRVTPIFVTGDFGYRIVRNVKDKDFELGDHGYNNSIKEMHPFFIAHGPAFKQGYQSKPFSIVDIYSLMCHILDITPAPNDGNFEAVSQMMLQSKPSNYVLFIVAIVVATLILVIMISGLIRNLRKRSYRFSRIRDQDPYS
jgi:ectonucleotide pyrophosphatase/phosphodiesterase family protein 5